MASVPSGHVGAEGTNRNLPGVAVELLGILDRGRPTWHRLALCRDGKVNFFDDNPKAIAKARQVCSGCPVQPQCQHFGSDEPAGVWGGPAAFERPKGRRRAG